MKCQFKTNYTDYHTGEYIQFYCPNNARNLKTVLTSIGKYCILHDENFVNNEANKQIIIDEFKKLANSGEYKYIGYYIPDYIKLFHGKHNPEVIYFNWAVFLGQRDFSNSVFDIIDFSDAKFHGIVNFSHSSFNFVKFQDNIFSGVIFIDTKFNGISIFERICNYDYINFNICKFSKPQEIKFIDSDMTRIIFSYTDISRISFSGSIDWGPKYKIYAAHMLENFFQHKDKDKFYFNIYVDDILATYRNLRENYEYNLRYDEAGKFFISEMEFQRNYELKKSNSFIFRHSKFKNLLEKFQLLNFIELRENYIIQKKSILESNIFSYIGLYRIFSMYGESITIPLSFLTSIFLLSVLWFTIQSNPSDNLDNEILESITRSYSAIIPIPIHLQNLTISDYLIKSAGFILFGLIFVSLRRKLERRFRH
ncbi:MAG: pentapeptide repeat-containing protein [Nitrososphaeraceae archaeon]